MLGVTKIVAVVPTPNRELTQEECRKRELLSFLETPHLPVRRLARLQYLFDELLQELGTEKLLKLIEPPRSAELTPMRLPRSRHFKVVKRVHGPPSTGSFDAELYEWMTSRVDHLN